MGNLEERGGDNACLCCCCWCCASGLKIKAVELGLKGWLVVVLGEEELLFSTAASIDFTPHRGEDKDVAAKEIERGVDKGGKYGSANPGGDTG